MYEKALASSHRGSYSPHWESNATNQPDGTDVFSCRNQGPGVLFNGLQTCQSKKFIHSRISKQLVGTETRFGFIQFFCIAHNHVFAVIRPLSTLPTNTISFVRRCRSAPISVCETTNVEVIEANHLLEKVLYIQTPCTQDIIRFPQSCT